jgi:hypothetical protein
MSAAGTTRNSHDVRVCAAVGAKADVEYQRRGPWHTRPRTLAASWARFDRLDVMDTAAIPSRPKSRAVRCGQPVEQIGHLGNPRHAKRLGRRANMRPSTHICYTPQGYGFAWLVGERVEGAPYGQIAGAPLSSTRARIGQNVSPPFFGRRLLRMRPGAGFDSFPRLDHRLDQSGDIGLGTVTVHSDRHGLCLTRVIGSYDAGLRGPSPMTASIPGLKTCR